MPRLFIAIDLPENIKDQVAKVQLDDIPGARWVSRPQLHLTLKFLGEVDDKKAALIQEKLNTIEAEAFQLQLSGVGCFPPLGQGKTKVVWANVENSIPLLDLHKAVETAVTPLGFKPEQGRFSPHITLARIKTKTPRGSVESFIRNQITFHADAFTVSEFVLFSSVLDRRGPTYTREGVYQLNAAQS